MNRRQLLRAIGASITVGALPSGAQVGRIPRVAWLSNDSREGNASYDFFREGLKALGYVEGRTVALEARWGDGALSAIEPLVAALVASQPDVIVTQGPAVRYVRATKTEIPVVFGFSGDPVAAGYVDSFSRPVRNMTGLSFMS